MTSILKVDTIQDQAGNNIINESSDTITIGASGDTVNIVGTLQNNGSGLISGITMVDQWRITSSFAGNHGFITNNLERNDSTAYGGIGTGMTESSGVFSFPSTGIYLVTSKGYWYGNGASVDYMGIETYVTTNNSTYVLYEFAYDSASATDYYGSTFSFSIIDVTNTTNVKVKFKVSTENINSALYGSTNETATGFTFIRLGDT